MKKSLFIFLIATATITYQGFPQEKKFFNNKSGFQYGYSIKASLDFGESKWPNFRLGLSGGVGIFAISDIIYPSINADIIMFSGGFGSARPLTKKPAIVTDIMLCATLTGGFQNRMRYASQINPGVIDYPLYFFSDLSRPSLQNPYNYSLSIGSNFVYRNQPGGKIQQVGFANLHVWRLQGSYINDGTPFQLIKFGDGHDRYYTGGGLLSYHGKPRDYFTLFEFGYHKYSGYTPNAFEASNLLDLAFVLYKDSVQTNYNKSRWTITVAHIPKHIGISLSALNHRKLDLQHKIHNSIFNAYHLVPHKAFMSPAAIGYYSFTKIGVK